jgi:uncharacterized sulfatase
MIALKNALLALLLFSCEGATEARHPHMVVFLSDDHSQADSSLYGAKDIPMPNLERLAGEGLVFTQAFAASPSCAPSRAAMLTGLMPARNGAEFNHTLPREGVASLIPSLQAAGYEVAAFGKVSHFADHFGFDVEVPEKSIPAVRANVARYLEDRSSKKPLCLFVGIRNPHKPWPQESAFRPEDVVVPESHFDSLGYRKARAAFYQAVSEVDRFLGELREISAEHLGKEVLFLYTSDNGSQWPFGKWNLYEAGIRVPLVVSWPGVVSAGARTDAMVSLADLLPTLIEVAGGNVPAGLDGRSFAAVLRGSKGEHRDAVFATHSGDGKKNIYPIRCIRTKEWKLIHNLEPDRKYRTPIDRGEDHADAAYWSEWLELAPSEPALRRILNRYFERPEFELYRVTEDPHELRNLAQNAENEEVRKSLARELEQWMESQGDTGKVDPLANPPRSKKE